MKHRLILGGALLGAFLALVFPAFAYDQKNTHPALTDEIVDFYNTNFPNEKLTDEEKQWLIKGSIDEDTGERPLFHFYDPVYNRGIFANLTSRDWALKDNAQANYYNKQLAGFPSLVLKDSSSDFSYARALNDYAKDDKKRALVVFGHVLHLLEDAGVPDHTRNDPHLPVLDWGSSYEHEMAKWNPRNFKIVSKLILQREKPVTLPSIENYFDRVAHYSNGYFFSKDTIDSKDYENPKILRLVNSGIKDTKGGLILYGLNKDKNDKDAKLVFLKVKTVDGILKISGKSLTVIANGNLKTDILDGYWERLSKEIVINGAGALNLFLEEAEKARQDYLVNGPKKEKRFFAQLLGVFGIGDNDNEELTTLDGQRTSEVKLTPLDVNRVTKTPTGGDNKVTPILSPSSSPVLSPKPSVSPVSTSSPQASLSPKISPPPSPTPKLTTSDGQRTFDVKTGRVVINEIAWAGTEASAADEWLELYNTENYDIDISGWTLKAEDGTPDITIGENGLTTSAVNATSDVKIIKAQSYFLLERTNDTTVNSIASDQLYTGALNNEGEFLKLSDSLGNIVDTVGNSGVAWPAGSSTGKYSMERISIGTAGDSQSNWKNFSGAPISHDVNNNFINGTPKTLNSPSVVTASGGGSGSQSVSPLPSPELASDTIGPVVINEISWMGTATSSNDEWLELYNNTSSPVDVTGWMLTAQDGTPSITLSGTVSGYGFFLLERTNDNVISDISANQIYTGALGNSGEGLKLKDSSGNIKDSADFATGWSAGNNTTKSSMERINPKTSGDSSSNWSTNNGTTKNGNDAAGNPINGTPKFKNSGYITLKPSAITDLAISSSFPTVTLTWSASEDLDTLTASLSYDIRYSTLNFPDENTWSTATKVASSSFPSVGSKGASQNASFDIYQYGQKIYLALKTKHKSDSSDISNISNTVSRETVLAIASTSWAMLGKDQYHTSLASVAGPGVTAAISWEYDLGSGYTVSQPVVATDGDVHFGAAKGSDKKLIKLDKNGAKQWEYATKVSISVPAILSNETVYFGRVGAGGVLAFTALKPDGSKNGIMTTQARSNMLPCHQRVSRILRFNAEARRNFLF